MTRKLSAMLCFVTGTNPDKTNRNKEKLSADKLLRKSR